MAYLADYLNGLTSAELSEVEAAMRSRVFGAAPFTIKPSGDGRNGVMDAKFDDATGYIFHLRAGVNSGSGTYAIGIGTDEGLGGGLLISHKNNGSAGFSLNNNPGAGIGMYAIQYSLNPAIHIDQYAAASPAIRIQAKSGQGVGDVVTTAGSSTITSATAAFVAGDVGKAISQLTFVASTSPAGCIPPGATIASVTNGTTAVMSAPATASGTGVRVKIAGRAISTGMSLFQVQSEDGSVRGDILFNRIDWKTPLRVTQGIAGNEALPVASFRAATSGQTGNLMEVTNNAGSVVFSRLDKNGVFMTSKTSAPADADISTGEMALWFDSTSGAAKLMIKAKDAGGTVRTASVALA
ncbi:hypothetical protein [Rhizobium sp. NFR03]|uniref:hypothetical protein n=1 Tax=Rhizobium sp. NFR03 TaxID=1566263 RepID=UPI0008C1A51D|nr:hypothetical protein [Rhizobium sp. NFR03]SES47256.1 hypothetical protein SAMN03159406_04960 [Rhizobium sp. NFR03]